ncbi:MAG: glycine zipper domain-containing protein [Planctomycetota bacterium]
MVFASTGRSASRRHRILLPFAVACCCATSAVNAQYRYVPAPDYYRNDTAEGTVVGGAFGALTGAIIGGKKDRGEGALIGAGVGALTGNLLGRSKDRADEYQAAVGASAVAHANRQAAAMAVTNFDLVRLTQAGVGDDVIISTIQSRGAALDLSPGGLIALKESGVSDAVLVAAQGLNRSYAAPIQTASPVVVQPAPATVIVAPQGYWGRPYRPYYRARCYPRAGLHYHFRF